MIDNIFIQIGVLLGITVAVAFVMRVLKQPLMTAYLIAGIVAGPFFLDLIQGDTHVFDAMAEFGVLLLLFMVGLSLNFEHIKKIGKTSVVTGLSQIVFTAGIGYGILRALEFSHSTSLYLALGITFSSTIIIVKLLGDKKDLQTVYGRYVVGLMIVQDLVALVLMILLTSTGQDASLQESVIKLMYNIALLIVFVWLVARYIVPGLLKHVATSVEFLFIFTIAWCFGVAGLLSLLGFSVEVGALIAGLTLGSSPFQSEISSRIKPLRDFFLVLFFIILGSELSLANLGDVYIPGLLLSAFILFGNPLILFFAFRISKFTRRNSFLAGVTAAQVSEFGFILLFTGVSYGHVGDTELQIFTMVALITIILSSYAITYNEQLYKKLLPVFEFFGPDKYRQTEEQSERYDAWVFGYHRIGWKVCEALAQQKIKFAVVDFNPAAIAKLKRRGIPAFFGDAADVEFLSLLPLDKAKLIISTLPEVDDQITMLKHVRAMSTKTHIITTLYHIRSLKELYDAGASYVLMPHLVGGNWMADVLSDHKWTKHTFAVLRHDQKEEMRLRYTVGMHE